MVAAPLAVCVGLNEPQEAAGAQDQSTPALELSFETVSVRVAVAPVVSDAGLPLMEPVIAGGVGGGALLEPPPQPISTQAVKMKAADTLILMNMKDHPFSVAVDLRLGETVRAERLSMPDF